MRCRLLYLIGQLRSGGSERQLYYLLQTVNRERYKPAVVVWNYRAEEPYVSHIRALGVPVYGLPHSSSGYLKLKAFRRLTQQLKPELLHSYSFYTNFPTWWAALGTRAVAIGAMRSDFTRVVKENGPWFGRLSAGWPRTQIYNSRLAAESAQRAKRLFIPRQLYVVRNGIDLQQFQAVPVPPMGRTCVLGVGSLLLVKRWDRLLNAVLSLKQKDLDFLVRIVGDGPLRDLLIQQVQDLNIDDCVEFMGYRDDISRLLGHATFLVHTSDSEGCPNAVMEAMACGRAVVATDVGDVPFLIDHQSTGFVVRRGDNPELIDRMATLIADRELCRRMGDMGHIKAQRDFGLDHLLSETLAVYRSAGWQDT